MGAHMGTIRDSLGDEILAHAKPITKLQMEDVRRMHECWVKMECNPGVDQKRFNKIFVMLRGANQRKLFELFAKGPPDKRFADVNEVFAVALINSSAFAASKMRALFELYDEDCSGELSLQEVVIMIASAMRGMSAATGGRQLDIETVETICHKTFDVIDAVVKDRTITSHEWALFCRNDLAMQRVLAKFSLAGKLQVSRSEAKDGGDSSPEASPRRRVDSGQVARRKSTLTQHPGLIRELKKELKMLRDVFDSIDVDGSGDIPLEEFMTANDKTSKGEYGGGSKFGPFQTDLFMKMDADGDGRVTWRELISLMYHKYGKTVIKEMLSWDASDWEDVGQRRNKIGHQVVKFDQSQVGEIKNMFSLYSPAYDGTIVVEDLASAMADLHGLDEEDLIVMFENVGKDRHSRVDADTYVDIFQELIQDDDGMYEILKSTSAGEQLAEHMKAKEGKKIANKILSAAPVRLS